MFYLSLNSGVNALEVIKTKGRNTQWQRQFLKKWAALTRRLEIILSPDLNPPEEETQPIGIWGQRHLRYHKEYRRVFYFNLLTSGKLNDYLADVDRQAEEIFSRLVKQMAEREGVTEKLKAENQMEWVGKRNAVREAATEIVNNDLIYS